RRRRGRTGLGGDAARLGGGGDRRDHLADRGPGVRLPVPLPRPRTGTARLPRGGGPRRRVRPPRARGRGLLRGTGRPAGGRPAGRTGPPDGLADRRDRRLHRPPRPPRARTGRPGARADPRPVLPGPRTVRRGPPRRGPPPHARGDRRPGGRGPAPPP